MLYDVGFEEASFLFLVVIYLYHKYQYSGNTLINKRFRNLLVLGGTTIALDIISAYLISFSEYVPLWLNNFTNGIYFMSVVLMTFYFTVYIKSVTQKIEDKSIRPYSITNLIILIAFIASEILNFFLPFFFYFSEEAGYVKGSLYMIQIFLPLYYVVYTCLLILAARRRFGKNQIMSMYGYAILTTVFTVVQVFFAPNVLMSGCSFCLAALILMFSMETPDYQKLQKTLAELEVARDEAEKANNAKSEFLARMSHEIRTPINIMNGMNEIIIRDSDDDEVIKCALDAKDAGENLLSLVNDILDFSKIESGKMSINSAPYNLRNLLRENINAFEPGIVKKGLDFKVEADSETPCELEGDEMKVKQIIMNLLSNAQKYTREGTVTLKVGYQMLSEKEVMLEIIVEDTGIGIKQEEIDRLFDSFERMDSEKNKSIQGTGLGLSITKKTVELMYGEIEVESTYGEGSSFIVRIPQGVLSEEKIGCLVRRRRDTKTDVKKKAVFKAPGAKILIVDDIPVNLKVVVGLLKNSEMEIDTASSGLECVEKVLAQNYDVVFVDHMMPNMDGIETLAKIHELKSDLGDTKFIALTANAIAGAKEMYLSKGFDDYLSKPVKGENMEILLEKYLSVGKKEDL